MVIDGHSHACGSYYGIDSIVDYMRKHRIDKVVLCGGEPNSSKDYGYPMLSKILIGEKLGYFFSNIICKVAKSHKLSEHIDQQNQFVYELSLALPDSIVNAYWINPLEESCVEKMQKFYDHNGFKLIKMHQCWTNFDMKCDNCYKIFNWAKTQRIPVFIHLLSQEQVDLFINMVNLFSGTYFIVAHMIGSKYMSSKLLNEHVYFDLSAPQLYSVNILKNALENYGAKHLLLGSDTPYGKNNIEITMARLRELNISNEDLESITGNNIIELLKL